jgi:hypothetical protein
VGKGGGTRPRRHPEFSPPTSKGTRSRRGWDGVPGQKNAPDGAGSACIIGAEGPPVPLPGLEATGPEKGRGCLGSYVHSQEARPGRQKGDFPHGNLGLGGMRPPFVSGGTCGGGTLPRGRWRSAGGPVFLRGGGGSGGDADGSPQSPQLNRPALLSPERRDPARQ